MFNRGAFNTMPFNREVIEGTDKYAVAVLEATSELIARASVDYAGKAVLTAESETDLVATRDRYGAATIEASSETEFVISTRLQATLEAQSELVAIGRRMQTQTIRFTGPIQPGEQLVIDMDKMTAVLNGRNVLNQLSGPFLELQPGENTLLYSDQNSARNIELITRYRERSY
ncbi:Phage tail protein [Aneurinibacillus thermoaerophilus]|uniref:Phage tail protein n=1 Tax=Aneurinibacillus thermoaerophilus TaxID=143495 RepID=A0A1G8F5W8_ANETH|nr:phage tail domain-containing protein [Aneurinibacillus thermoaerophilus]SDH77511.1 Phage tail protein [Aneurinibacillus thermoaerophilus]